MILVTAPTSQIGHHVVNDLLSAGNDVRVVARDPSKLSDLVRDRVEVVKGSHGNAAVPGEHVVYMRTTQDFVLVNGPVFQSKTAEQFLGNLKMLAKTTDTAEG